MAAAVLVAALQLILGPRRHVPRRSAMVRRATEPLTANILAAGRAAQADKAAAVDLLLRPEVEHSLRLRRSQPLVVSAG